MVICHAKERRTIINVADSVLGSSTLARMRKVSIGSRVRIRKLRTAHALRLLEQLLYSPEFQNSTEYRQ